MGVTVRFAGAGGACAKRLPHRTNADAAIATYLFKELIGSPRIIDEYKERDISP
jgi:hypothetical protein